MLKFKIFDNKNIYLSLILEFLIDCQINNYNKSLKYVNKNILDNFPKCQLICFKKLVSCRLHGNSNKIQVIETLNAKWKRWKKTSEPVSTIHFEDTSMMQIAKPYLHKFGNI